MRVAKYLGIIAIGCALLAGCKKEGCTDEKATNYEEKAKKDDGSCTYPTANVYIDINHLVNGASLVFDSREYTSQAGNKYSIETLKYFISDVIIHGESGDVTIDDEFYIDGEDASTLSIVTGTSIEAGSYSGITFSFGIKAAKNVTGRYTNPPETNMEWPAVNGGGYHYMKLEGSYDSLNTGTVKFYNTHLGGTMGNDNHFDVEFSRSFTLKGETKVTLKIDVELDNWYENPTTYDFNGNDNGIMMNQTVQETLKANGADVFSLGEIDLE